jgi:hypothetical protein
MTTNLLTSVRPCLKLQVDVSKQAWRDPAADPRGPASHRAHTAIEPRDLYGPLRPRARDLRRHEDGARTEVRCGRFSFNVAKGRCEHCDGEGFVMVELLFLPSVYTPCPTCPGHALQREDARGDLQGP